MREENKRIVYTICDDKQIKMTRDVFDYLMTVKHYNKKLQQENERLNNIINELEKYLENRNSFFNEMFRDYGTHRDLLDENENILDKLKELKESDNNE